MRVLLYTLGCKLNQCESEAIADAFSREGFEVVTPDGVADLCIVNTCTVTGKAEQKARRMIRKYANGPQRPVVLVTGCYAQMERQLLEGLSPNVVVVSLDDKPSLLDLPNVLAHTSLADIDLYDAVRHYADHITSNAQSDARSPFDYDAETFSFHSRAFLKIQDGCDNNCAYCRVTIARGKAVSLAIDEVIARAKALERDGYREIVLTGVNISAYKCGDADLKTLLSALLDHLGSDMRIRLSSLEPDKLDEQLIAVFADSRIQPHFHIPIQSASQKVLDRVDRHYPVDRLKDAVEQLRRVKSDPFIAADIITGLPGEDDAEFDKTVDFLKEMDVSQLHVFPFSPRPQTALFDATDRVPEYVRDERATRLRRLSAVHHRRYMQRQVGHTFEMILEERHEGIWTGLTENYLRIKVSGVPPTVRRGERIVVRLERSPSSPVPVGIYQSDHTPE